MLELRAATDLARLWRDAGSPNDPRALLEPILAQIESGETTRDVRQMPPRSCRPSFCVLKSGRRGEGEDLLAI